MVIRVRANVILLISLFCSVVLLFSMRSIGRVDLMVAEFKKLYGDQGLEYNFKGTVSHTLHAHRLVEYLQQQQIDSQVVNKVVEQLFKAYHTDGKALSE